MFIQTTGQTLNRSEKRGGVLLFPRCQETAECPVICPCHNVLLSISFHSGKKTLRTPSRAATIKGTLSMTSAYPIMGLYA